MVYVIGLRTHLVIQGQRVNFRPDRFLKTITQETGGGSFEIVPNTTELNSTFSRVADELHRQYLIGISPTVLDGKLHTLDVRALPPGMTTRARKTYMATKDGSTPK